MRRAMGTTGPEFIGKEQDAESGLDYFGARYMPSAQGRFTSSDRDNAMLIKQNMESAGLPAPQRARRTYRRQTAIAFLDRPSGACVIGVGSKLKCLSDLGAEAK